MTDSRAPSCAEPAISSPGIAGKICAALNEPVRLVEIDDGDGRTLLVEPLRFHKVYVRDRKVVVKRKPE